MLGRYWPTPKRDTPPGFAGFLKATVIEGVYQGHDVYLTVLSEAPADEEPSLKLDTTGKAE